MNINYKIGDCREVLKNFEDGVFDACVTDPPYGLEFMGKEWDKLADDWGEATAPPDRRDGTRIYADGKGRTGSSWQFAEHTGRRTPRYHAGKTAQDWHLLWAKEVYRVLKPGGYLLAFGGTRTYHRMVCAVEDAGFEIRDTIAWIYGSGFPKSMDISKQIDKLRNDDVRHVCRFLEARMGDWRITDIVEAMGFKGGGDCGVSAWFRENHVSPRVPTWEQWIQLKGLLGFGDEMDAEVWRLNGRKGKPGEAWYEREVIGEVTHSRSGGEDWAKIPGSTPRSRTEPITAPATPDAKKWSGYGTALKPAVEPIVVARKPISEKNVAMNVLTHGVGGLNIDATRIEGNVGKPWGRVHPHRGNYPGWQLDKDMVEAPEPHPQGRFPANIILECTCEKVIPGKVGEVDSGLHFAKSRFGFGDNPPDGRESVAYNDTAPIHTNPNCPCYMLDAQSGLLESGSGDRNRVIHAQASIGYGGSKIPFETRAYGDRGGPSRFFYVAKASRKERWFYCSVCNKAYSGDKREAHKKHSMHCLDCDVDYEPMFSQVEGGGNIPQISPRSNFGDRYPAKVIDDHKSHNTKSNLLFHVTQKPEQLIRYLIRLVTPKGGTVLDPFLGSGTTLVAARMEGMNALGIEIGTEYEPLISARIEQKSIYQFQETE